MPVILKLNKTGLRPVSRDAQEKRACEIDHFRLQNCKEKKKERDKEKIEEKKEMK